MTVLWQNMGPFESPESAAIDLVQEAIFVSNVSGYERNGAGFISRLSLDGEMVDRQWLAGLNAPTGLAVQGETLWVVDFDRLVEVDIPTASVRRSYPVADTDPLLNDISVGPDGNVFVTGSASNTIYRLSDDQLLAWRRDDEILRFANGISVSADHVIVAAYHLVKIDRSDGTITEPIGDPEHLYDLESVVSLCPGRYLISVIGNRPLYSLEAGGRTVAIASHEPYLADFDIARDMLVVPSGDMVVAFRLSESLHCDG